MSGEVQQLLGKSVVVDVEPIQGHVFSNLILRPKKDGGHRLILDLTWVNLHLEYEHFKMTSINTAREMIAEELRHYLRFRWNGRLFQFRVLPNGLARAPRIFTKILAPAFARLREKGVETFPYIDDSFLLSNSYEKCQEGLEELQTLLVSLGFMIHRQKSVLEPTKELTFLGFVLDSKEFKIFLPIEKEEKLRTVARETLSENSPTIREVAGFPIWGSARQGFGKGNDPSVRVSKRKL